MRLRSENVIAREYRRANREIRRLLSIALNRALTNAEAESLAELRGTQQALGWALTDNAAAPVKSALPRAAAPTAKEGAS